MVSSTWCGRPKSRSRPMPGARICQRTRVRSPTGLTPGGAATAPRPSTPIDAGSKHGPLRPAGRSGSVAAGRETTKLSDAATGQEVPDLAPDSLDRIIVNNRLRGAIEGALGALTLFSPDREARLAAAQDALRHPSADTLTLLDKALSTEQDPEIRTA